MVIGPGYAERVVQDLVTERGARRAVSPHGIVQGPFDSPLRVRVACV